MYKQQRSQYNDVTIYDVIHFMEIFSHILCWHHYNRSTNKKAQFDKG